MLRHKESGAQLSAGHTAAHILSWAIFRVTCPVMRDQRRVPICITT
jgi:hypothetical protein